MMLTTRASALSHFALCFGALVAIAGCTAESAPSDSSEVATSNYTANTTITFAKDGSDPVVGGALRAGTTVKVAYVANRLINAHPECLHHSPHVNGYGFVQMGARFNGDAKRTTWQGVSTGGVDHPDESMDGQKLLAIPADVTKLELWFSCGTNAYQDQAWDSKDGQNYVFDVAPASTANGPITTFSTPSGNAVEASLVVGPQETSGLQYSRPYTITIAFDDVRGFAGDYYEKIHAVVGLETHRVAKSSLDRPTSLEWRTIELVRDGQRFVGKVEVSLGGTIADSDTILDAVQVAVSNDQGKWESNDAKNYRFTF